MSCNILVIGSSTKDKGGIVTVIKNINRHLSSNFKVCQVNTYITTNNPIKKLFYFLSGLVQLCFRLMFRKIDIVHIHMSYKGSFYRKSVIILLCKLFNKPVIVHVHGSTFKDFYNNLNPSLKKYVKFILNKTDKLVVLSKEWSDFFSIFVKKEKIFILYNGVEVSEKSVSSIKKDNQIVNCVFLGRLGQRKGIYDLLDSIKILKERNIKAVFYIAGDGEIQKVKSKVKQYGIEDYVKIVGWINDEEREKLLTNSEVLVLPSYNEGLPMAILESMSYGLTIISTPVGGIPEAVNNGENGFLVTPGDSAALAKAIEKSVINENWRNQVKKVNRIKISEQFNLTKLIKNLEELYLELSYKKGE
ncbi:glycosyltransferase family 4 protein [Metabacillus indicus]|uniref:Glycosyl transferase family 1 domain-containing protein n=1 Tax=Metabacillus indicus TaxID=246786 RepID=A0A084GXY5_METID|nr:glycosyltransferase family 4 protein [Metabacillus indicus]KEZ52197.1 hypothetical protein GS18_0214085 [Metabacillus indicus]